MIKIFIGKRDYRYPLKILLEFIDKNKPLREFTYSVDNVMVDADVQVYVTELFSSECIKEHSVELTEDIFVHIEEGIGIYSKGEAVSIDVLEDCMRGMK
ncbi:TreE [Staphylococcus phage Stab23]|nr:TreE [Staphylococcus phage Stab23]VEV88758.1 TreE [Staphylococcus phage Stab23]